ncbi:MAG: peptidylprolyl isomerase [Candidatus Saccharibacteria bacterium]
MAKDPDIKTSKKAAAKKPSVKKARPAKASKTTKDQRGTKNVSFQEKLKKLNIDPEKNKKTLRIVGIGALVALIVTITTFGVLIYRYKMSNRAVKIASRVIPYPVASVNGNILYNTVTYNDYLFELASIEKFYQSQNQDLTSAEGKAKLAQLKNDLITQLENNLLIQQQAKQMGITVTNKEVDDQFNQLVQNAGGLDKVKATLDKLYGWSVDDFKQKIRDSLLQQKVGNKITTDESLNAPAKAQAEDILKQIQGGADFATLAKQYSQDGSAANGGDLGLFSKGQLDPDFEAAAFALQPGQTSGIVKTQYGYHIIKVTDKQGDQIRASHILIKGIDLDSWLRDQRAKAHIVQYFFPN